LCYNVIHALHTPNPLCQLSLSGKTIALDGLDIKMFNRSGNYGKAAHLLNQGIDFAEAGDLNAAIADLKSAVQVEPDDGVVRYNLGLAYLNNQMPKESLEELRLAIRFSPDFVDSYFGLATCYWVFDEDYKAAANYRAFLERSKDNKVGTRAKERLKELGSKAWELDERKWLEDCEHKLQDLVNHFGQIGLELGDDISAKKPESRAEISSGLKSYFTKAAPEKAREWSLYHFSNGEDLLNKEFQRTAIVQFIEGLELFPHDHLALSLLAAAHAEVGDLERSTKFLELIDLEKAEDETKPILREQVVRLKKFIQDHTK
jgi:tetratricopeptide (TPR) repeat protein